MSFNTSPLESLLAFFIVFVSGALSAIGLARYVQKVRRDASGAHPST